MRRIYLTSPGNQGRINEIEGIENGCIINLVAPTEEETAWVAEQLAIDLDDLRAPLDLEERSRVKEEDDYSLIIIDIPLKTGKESLESYDTIPFGIIVTKDALVTTCQFETPLMNDFLAGKVREFRTSKKTRFILQFLLNTANTYLQYLRAIDAESDRIEKALHRSMRNKELIDMLGLEKSLVYFSTSLRSNQRVLDRLLRMKHIVKYSDDEDLLEDAIEENRQAIEMADIYSNILSGTMDAYASVISNNQSTVMKLLALVTIIMSIPTMVFSAYGMNVAPEGMPFSDSIWGFVIIIGLSAVISGLAALVFFIKKWF